MKQFASCCNYYYKTTSGAFNKMKKLVKDKTASTVEMIYHSDYLGSDYSMTFHPSYISKDQQQFNNLRKSAVQNSMPNKDPLLVLMEFIQSCKSIVSFSLIFLIRLLFFLLITWLIWQTFVFLDKNQ